MKIDRLKVGEYFDHRGKIRPGGSAPQIKRSDVVPHLRAEYVGKSRDVELNVRVFFPEPFFCFYRNDAVRTAHEPGVRQIPERMLKLRGVRDTRPAEVDDLILGKERFAVKRLADPALQVDTARGRSYPLSVLHADRERSEVDEFEIRERRQNGYEPVDAVYLIARERQDRRIGRILFPVNDKVPVFRTGHGLGFPPGPFRAGNESG